MLTASNISFLQEQIAWDSEHQKIYIGIRNQDLAKHWVEYLSCSELLPIPLKFEAASVISKPRIKYEIVSDSDRQLATNLVIELQLKALDLNETPPKFQRNIADFQRGTLVRILYSSTPGDRRVGKEGVVTNVKPEIRQVSIDLDNGYSTWTKLDYVKPTGFKKLPPATHWYSEDDLAWEKLILWVDGKKTDFYIAKAKWASYRKHFNIPEDKPYALFQSGEKMLQCFESITDAQNEAVKLISQG